MFRNFEFDTLMEFYFGAFDSGNYDMTEAMSSEPEDRLSELPDSLIFHIWAFLPTIDVVRTTLLSNRWKTLSTTITCLDFNDRGMQNTDIFRNFVNGALKLCRGVRILKFNVTFGPNLDKSDVDSWVCFAEENEVEGLYFEFMYPYDEVNDTNSIPDEVVYWVPQNLYSCSSLTVLSLLFCNFKINGNVHWNQLKSLTIDCSDSLREDVINQVLSGCPQLEVFILSLLDSNENLSIQSSSLKRLSIRKGMFIWYDDPTTTTKVRICAPNLETLEMSIIPYGKCLLTDVSSLTHATLTFYDPHSWIDMSPYAGPTSWNDLVGETLRQIFPAIQHVERVTLSHCCIKVAGAMQNLLPTLSNVNFLELKICFAKYEEIVDGLGIFPELETLVLVEDNERSVESCVIFERNLPNTFLQQLRTIEVTWSEGDNTILPFIEFLLKHASSLEKIVCHKKYRRDEEVFCITGTAEETIELIQHYMDS